ncbi:MAG: T9SS type A sorting domain-containing protein [Saprospiraceae bacterium]|nr:T9SS type A sorting domain-containing protein [Saprospiraceae bacterium]
MDIPGATNPEYCIDQVTAEYDRRQFRVLTFESSDNLRSCAISSAAATLEIEGDPVLVCNDLVNISLDHNCLALITPDMVLEDTRFESRLRIRIVDNQNIAVPNPITSAYVGETLTVYAYDILNGNSCWSTIKIEDKLPPVITCPQDYTVSCANNNFFPPTPLFADACDPTATMQLVGNVLTELACGRQDSVIAIRELTYIAKDKYGNTSAPCIFRVYYKSININNIVWPSNLELSCRVVPTYPAWDFNRNGKPDPSETGVPKILGLDLAFASSVDLISNTYCKVNVAYHDTELALCGNTYKIVRDWTVLDWCNGIILRHAQLIAIKDNQGPVVSCPLDQNYDIFTQDHACTADFEVPAPIVISDCNSTTWSVGYLLADNNGLAPVNGQYITDNVVQIGSKFTITDLPTGRTWLRYTVIDACENISYCYTEVTVYDKIRPTPICDEFTVVTLTHNGKALVYAETFDDGSHDNCSEVSFSVRRLTAGCGSNGSSDESINPFGPYVELCCGDVGTEIMVELKVKDASGNENSCMVTAIVNDKVPPVITCPAPILISCGADTSANVLGKPIYSAAPISTPYYSDNCLDLKLTWQNRGTISECGQGIITRTFTVTDKAGNKTSCEQIITVRNTTPYNGPVLYVSPSPYANGLTWKNLEPRSMTGCMTSDINPANTGEPELGNGACSLVAKNYEDQIVPFVDGVCFKILRKWTVIDWCKFSPNTDINGDLYPTVPVLGVNMWTYIQTIAVSETDAPVLQNCSKGDTETTAENCTAQVELINTAQDCTPNEKLRWTYTIDTYNDGIGPFINGSSNNASGNYPVGLHNISWTVEDMCGNQSTCSHTFRVVDKKKPTPYCISELSTVIMPTVGQVELWAKDFDKGSSDNCPVTGCGLKFTFNGFKPPVTISEVLFDVNGNIAGSWPTTNATLLDLYANGIYQRWLPSTCSSAKLYTCDDLGSNTENMSVWDAGGNTDFCTVKLFVQANGTSCPGYRIAGNIGTEYNNMVSNVSLLLSNDVNNESVAVVSDVNGYFEFNAITPGTSYTIIPEKDTDHLNGVSTLDLVIIQRHILGLSDLDSPYKFKAADINNDKKITASDLVELRKLILGVFNKYPKNTSWRFVDKAEKINVNGDVFFANEYVRHDTINTAMMQSNFVAIKVGDVNGSASVNAQNISLEQRASQKLTLSTFDQSFKKGESLKIPILADNFTNISGAQWTLNYDVSNLVYKNIEPGALDLTAENINVVDGKIAFSWNDIEVLSMEPNTVLFTLEFMTQDAGNISSSLSLSSDIAKAEAYTRNLEAIQMDLQIRNSNLDVFALEQNNPNPFTTTTTISFTLPEDGHATVNIFDITGKVLKSINGQFAKGKNELMLSAEDFNAQGVMFYELESKGRKATKKMIYLYK